MLVTPIFWCSCLEIPKNVSFLFCTPLLAYFYGENKVFIKHHTGLLKSYKILTLGPE